jgi:hypothetical protein
MKILKTKKYAQEYDPFKVDFNTEAAKAKNMETNQLLYALKDAIEASQVSANAGKYFDQASVYRTELGRRGMSNEDQDRQLKGLKSIHKSI